MPNTSEPRPLTLKTGESAVGWDLGNSASKISLAYIKNHNEVVLVRVPFAGSRDDPDQSNTPHDFVACAALRDGNVVVGKLSLDSDLHLPLKTMLAFLAGIKRKKTVEALPGGRQLLETVKKALITTELMENAIVHHFEVLRTSVLEQARSLNVTIKFIVITYPNYLASQSRSGDHELYLKRYLSLLAPLWGEEIHFETVSEGQAAANYICERFEDPYSALHRRTRQETLFRGLNPDLGLNLLVVDGGASTLTYLQGMSVYFTEDGEISDSSSNVPHGAVTGVQGGSQMTNDWIRRFIIEGQYTGSLVSGRQLEEGDLAVLLQDYEEKKKKLNYLECPEALALRGKTLNVAIFIPRDRIQEAFDLAYREGLKLLKQELSRITRLGKDFAVLFAGGSFCNRGLYNTAKAIMEEAQRVAEARNIKIEYAFIRDEHYWSSAVSAGAALAMTWVPLPCQILKGSAIGVQLVWKEGGSKAIWVGEYEAHVLFSPDFPYSFRADIDIPGKADRVLELGLVCHPQYSFKPLATQSPRAYTDTIRIGAPEEVLGGPSTTYDLGWTMKLTGLRAGRVRLVLEEADSSDHSLSFVLTRYTLDSSDQVTPCALDKRWLIQLKSDPVTKLLLVGDVEEMPLLCCSCEEEIKIAASICQSCKNFAQCYHCFNQTVPTPSKHARHTFRIVMLEHVGV
ncbi:hypothetical protein F5Y08DRAFT_339490 [Xylaria arbuscula]|nr:hypothetical protein F5Y08DRAFT_339490 [Xylaria arbuscula]